VQKQTPQAVRSHAPVERKIAVLLIARDRVPEMRGVHPDLMHATGSNTHLDQGAPFKTIHRFKQTYRWFSIFVHQHSTCSAR
jgi:hypothetical protein